MSRDQLATLLRACHRGSQFIILIQAIGALALAVGGGVLFALDPDQILVSGIGILANQILLGSIIGIVLLTGLHLLRRWIREKKSLVADAILADPARLVWVYETPIYSNGVHTRTEITFGMSDGTMDILQAAHLDRDQILAGVGAVCPHATIGYSDELAARFRQSPISLARAA